MNYRAERKSDNLSVMVKRVWRSRKYYLFGPKGFRAKRKVWGFCAGDAEPCYMWERRWFDSTYAAWNWVDAEPVKPGRRGE